LWKHSLLIIQYINVCPIWIFIFDTDQAQIYSVVNSIDVVIVHSDKRCINSVECTVGGCLFSVYSVKTWNLKTLNLAFMFQLKRIYFSYTLERIMYLGALSIYIILFFIFKIAEQNLTMEDCKFA
jgi:hypothetical protein